MKKSRWIIGGDGWGLRHASAAWTTCCGVGCRHQHPRGGHRGSFNTGGQSSKSTPGWVPYGLAVGTAKRRKKDLSAIAAGYAYVAQVSIGASQQQLNAGMAESRPAIPYLAGDRLRTLRINYYVKAA